MLTCWRRVSSNKEVILKKYEDELQKEIRFWCVSPCGCDVDGDDEYCDGSKNPTRIEG